MPLMTDAVYPIGYCCGQKFWTWEGWMQHLHWHREVEEVYGGTNDH